MRTRNAGQRQPANAREHILLASMQVDMMQSVALHESSCYTDDDYVVVELEHPVHSAKSIDPMDCIMDCEIGADDDESYDYCDDMMYETAEMSAHASPTGSGISLAIVMDDSYNADQGYPSLVDAALLDAASSMFQEMVGWEADLNEGTDDARSMKIPETEADSQLLLSPDHEERDTSAVPSLTQEALPGRRTVPNGQVAAAATVASASLTETRDAQAVKAGPPFNTSRPSNKKRRKQLKMAKKAAAAAYLAQLALNDPSMNLSSSLGSNQKKLVQSNVTATTCSPQAITDKYNLGGTTSLYV
jgi:hypothetical protein